MEWVRRLALKRLQQFPNSAGTFFAWRDGGRAWSGRRWSLYGRVRALQELKNTHRFRMVGGIEKRTQHQTVQDNPYAHALLRRRIVYVKGRECLYNITWAVGGMDLDAARIKLTLAPFLPGPVTRCARCPAQAPVVGGVCHSGLRVAHQGPQLRPCMSAGWVASLQFQFEPARAQTETPFADLCLQGQGGAGNLHMCACRICHHLDFSKGAPAESGPPLDFSGCVPAEMGVPWILAGVCLQDLTPPWIFCRCVPAELGAPLDFSGCVPAGFGTPLDFSGCVPAEFGTPLDFSGCQPAGFWPPPGF